MRRHTRSCGLVFEVIFNIYREERVGVGEMPGFYVGGGGWRARVSCAQETGVLPFGWADVRAHRKEAIAVERLRAREPWPAVV